MPCHVYVLASRKHGTLYIARAIQREKTMKEWPRAWKIRLAQGTTRARQS
jgi:predicted GIY-YIG superfamily endonuclease